MDKLKRAYRFVKERYEFLSLKKYTTLAGTLVFFLIMSIVPLSFWVTLILGRLPIDTDRLLALPVFSSVKDILLYVRREAESATSSTSLLLLLTTLYSATNLFYQMRRSGEIIYDYRRQKRSIRVRLGAFLLLLIVMVGVAAFFILFGLGTFVFSRYFPEKIERIADYALLGLLAFGTAFLLNIYICPYKERVIRFLPGTFLTVGAWGLAAVGFEIYLRLSNMRKLYGALTTVIVFLLWLYVLMICFIVGVIFNSEKISTERKRENRKRRKAHTG